MSLLHIPKVLAASSNKSTMLDGRLSNNFLNSNKDLRFLTSYRLFMNYFHIYFQAEWLALHIQLPRQKEEQSFCLS
jgi:hypothetical protein